MKTEVLERHGIPGEAIKRWHKSGIRQLLPIQIQSVNRFGILDGKSIIISGPGTSGKTFCGEMAALKTASAREKTVFLVPLKAIAVEKYKTFNDRYSPLGLKIRLSTRDSTEYEKDIIRDRFDILISIYEKFNALTSKDITLIKSCHCFILDEFQMISDPERGAELELIVAKIRKFNPAAQIVILLGGGVSSQDISDWLDIPVLEETRRPVDLRLGVLFRGTFHFRGFNNHDEGDERWMKEREQFDDSPIDPQTLSAIRLLAERGEQTIIFTSTKKSAVELARYLSKELNLKPSKNIIPCLDDLPQSIQNELLGQCFYGGAAFHHAELDQEQRELVETGFRNGEIMILVSTSTLAWGVNLPAKNVFIESMKYSGSKTCNCRDTLIPLSAADYTQAAGRAGRIGCDRDYGRAVLTATSPFEREILWENYVYGESSVIKPGLTEERLPELMVRMIDCGVIDSVNDLYKIYSDIFWSRFVEFDELSKSVENALDYLRKSELIQVNIRDRMEVTMLGQIMSASGFSVQSVIDIYEKSISNRYSTVLEWLYVAFGLTEWSDHCGFYHLYNVSSDALFKRLNELTDSTFADSELLVSKLYNMKSGLISRRFFEMLFALEWISGRPVRELEELFNRGSGGLRQDSLQLSWIITTTVKILEINKESIGENIISGLSMMANRLRYGLPAEKIKLAETLKLDREFVNLLHDFGISSTDDIRNTDPTFLREILPAKIVSGILDRLNRPESHSKENRPDLWARNREEHVFTGNNVGMKKEIKIRDKSIFLQPRLYSYYQKLWRAGKSDNPWIHKESLEPGLNQTKYISKLRRVFRDNNLDLKIVSDGAGRYKLLLPEREDGSVVAGDN